ncbi:MAG: hypothetical protein KDB00_26240 [Planctomycetales bacterium]|nr:hypothetical protein [Planctomycetales bacterium]
MARTTGHTIAGDLIRAHSSTAAYGSRIGGMLLAIALLSALPASSSEAGKPGAKSHYRSPNDGQASSASQDGNKPADDRAEEKTNFPVIRSLFGVRKDDESGHGDELIAAVPMERLTVEAQQKLAAISDHPSLYRRLPTQAIRCDEELFLFLTRKPETIIGIWDLMGITKVQANRVGPYKMDAEDGCGTTCEIDLIYGDRNLHVFVADGMYDGKFAQKPILGKGVFVFKSSYAIAADGSTTVTGVLDCYIKFESLGADLLARSLGVLIGKSADHNFVETAKFISQISQASETNPDGMLELVDRMPQVDAQTKMEFAQVIMNVSRRYAAKASPVAKLIQDR